MLYCFWDMVRDRCNYFSFWAIFLLFYPPNIPKNEHLKKWKKPLEILSFYTSVPKIIIICSTVPEIWCVTDVIIFHFRAIICPFTLKSLKNQNFKKNKKIARYIIILHKCTKNQDHMLYYPWDMARDGFNCYFWLWTIFCPFTPLTTQKKKILLKWKKYLEISLFYTSVSNIMIIWYTVSEIWHVTDVIVIFQIGPFFALLPL